MVATAELAIEFLGRAKIVASTANACFAWLIWDWILCADQEWRLIWRKKLTVGSWLYIVLRLYSLTSQLFDIVAMVHRWTNLDFCKGFYMSIAIGTYFQVFLVQLILQGRVYALYNCDRRVLVLNGSLYSAVIIFVGVVMARDLPHIKPTSVPKPILGCWASIPKSIFTTFIPSVVFECWLWILVTARGYYQAYDQERRTIFSGGALIGLLVRDAFLWFTAAAILSIANMLAFIFLPTGYNFICIPIFHTITAIGGCRLVLNVRERYYTAGGPVNEIPGQSTWAAATRATMTGAFGADIRRRGDEDLDEDVRDDIEYEVGPAEEKRDEEAQPPRAEAAAPRLHYADASSSSSKQS